MEIRKLIIREFILAVVEILLTCSQLPDDAQCINVITVSGCNMQMITKHSIVLVSSVSTADHKSDQFLTYCKAYVMFAFCSTLFLLSNLLFHFQVPAQLVISVQKLGSSASSIALTVAGTRLHLAQERFQPPFPCFTYTHTFIVRLHKRQRHLHYLVHAYTLELLEEEFKSHSSCAISVQPKQQGKNTSLVV